MEQKPVRIEAERAVDDYQPPDVTYLGSVAELTQKDVGATDGSTFVGVDLGS